MVDIKFLMDTATLRREIMDGIYADWPVDKLFALLEKHRSRHPVVFNIETTNACNMKCVMCPRTTLMKRPIQIMDQALFGDIVKQISGHTLAERERFFRFVETAYGLKPTMPCENVFYFYTSTTHLTLHGYGEPLLDPCIVERVGLCSSLGLPTYFSCVPANIIVDRIERLMDAGLGVLKFSIDALSDEEQRRIRGPRNNFTESAGKIREVIALREKKRYATKIVLTLIELATNHESYRQQEEFMNLWRNDPVFAYVKSQDNRWFHQEDEAIKNRSHYESSYCEFPWSSLTVLADGSVVPCTQDYNAEMILGNARTQPLKDIWEGEAYVRFRRQHLAGCSGTDLKCVDRCDIKMLAQRKGRG